MGKNAAKFRLGPEDQERLETLLAEGIDTKDKRSFVVAKLTSLWEQVKTRDKGAERIVLTMAATGMMQNLNREIGREKTILVDPVTGKAVDIPKRANVRVRDGAGIATGATQATIWFELSVPDFIAWANGQLALAGSMEIKARFIRVVLTAAMAYPDATSVGDACRQAGIDPETIQLDLAV